MTRRAPAARLEAWDKTYVWHPFTQHYLWEKETPLIIESGRGVYLRDVRGRRYLDGVSSLWVNLWGHRHPALDRALKQQLSKIAHSTFLGLTHPPAIELARALARVAPGKITRTFFSDNGATAVEVALKMAFQYWLETTGKARPEFLALQGSYHGDTLGAVSVGSIGAFHSKFKPLLFRSHFALTPRCYGCPFNKKKTRHVFRTGEKIKQVPRPGDMRAETGCRWECLKSVETLLKKRRGRLSAAILEPVVQAATGMNVMPPGYVAGFERLCRRAGVLLIADEVATGFGRTGTLFAVEQERVSPDFLCVAKALTAGYMPLAATLTTEKMYRAFRAPLRHGRTFFHGHSYSANPLGSSVALANLQLIRRGKLLEKTRRKAHLLKDALRSLTSLPVVASVRQAGLMVGIQLVAKRDPDQPFPASRRMGVRVCQRLLKKGVWLRPLGDVLVILPPAVVSEDEIIRLVREVRSAILHECPS